ncbi:unnamed protein product [Larinioides sclopetarius]|uniref:Uncharacterized protein n=1 Tax=Larinioides sclopetarius TaxID=280406 RepID=A0AAV1ZCQ4_9ARAC
MAIKGIFNCFKIIGGVANFMGPYGKIVGTKINGVSTVAEPLTLDNEKDIPKIPSGIESSLKTLKENIEAMRGKKVAHLEKLLKNVEEEVNKNPETLSLKDLTSKIKETKDKLQKIRDKELAFKNVKVLETELEETIKRKEWI